MGTVWNVGMLDVFVWVVGRWAFGGKVDPFDRHSEKAEFDQFSRASWAVKVLSEKENLFDAQSGEIFRKVLDCITESFVKSTPDHQIIRNFSCADVDCKQCALLRWKRKI